MKKNLFTLAICLFSAGVIAADRPAPEYAVHDMSRPVPPVVTPGTNSTQEAPGRPPSDAVVLFDGKNLDGWKANERPWFIKDGSLIAQAGSGELVSNEEFGDCQIHVEWLEPKDVQGNGQERGNSGVFVMGLYEVQVLEAYANKTYPDGMAAAIYGQYPPLANAARAPGEWQTYDIVFHRAKSDPSGQITQRARISVLWNGVLVQDEMELIGPTVHGALAHYSGVQPEKGLLKLQDHGFPVEYRNIWVRPLPQAHPAPPVRPAKAAE